MNAIFENATQPWVLLAGAIWTPTQIFCFAAFVFAVAVILYGLFGYPLLLGFIAKHTDNPVHKDDQLRSVSFVIAVRNGEKFIERKLRSIFALNYPRELMEILVVSDGSDDRTDEIAASFASEGVKVLRVPHGGKPEALNVASRRLQAKSSCSPMCAKRWTATACAISSRTSEILRWDRLVPSYMW